MISYLKGEILLKKERFIILDVGGVGYKVFLSKKSLSRIPQEGKPLKVFCFLNVRENILDLYGFLDFEELEFFELLDAIPGVGPRAALEISSLGSLWKVKEEILAHNEEIFEKVSGIGRKKAQTIILELSGKIREKEKKKAKKKEFPDEAIEALINLGFSRQKAREAVSKVPEEIKTTEQKIKQALKILGR